MINKELDQKEKETVVEELIDIKDHYETLIEDRIFDEGIEKEKVIERVDTIDRVIKKLS